MPWGLKRYQASEQSHFVTFSCDQRLPRLRDDWICELFVECLERVRRRYRFRVYGYVVMPEHVHLLISEPDVETLAKVIQALKISVSQRMRYYSSEDSVLWQKRYYDHNVHSYESFVDKLRYIHRNPVKRELVANPVDWKWSSFRHYATSEVGVVEIESQWTADVRDGRTPRVLEVQERSQSE